MALFTWPTDEGANEIVLEGWEQQKTYANSTFTTALKFLDKTAEIAQGIGNIPIADVSIGELTTEISPFEKPNSPDVTEINANFPVMDTSLSLGEVSLMEVPTEPEFTAVEPEYDDVAEPAQFSGTVPTKPDIPDRTDPAAPGEDLPAVPTMRDVLLPVAQDLVPVEFTASLPLPLESAPDASFSWSEQQYASNLLTAVDNKLQALVAGMSTGLDPAVEQQIWDRARRRTSIATRRLKAQTERFWVSAGWTMPGGDLTNKHYEAEQEAVNADISESRAIAIAQAELEQKNFQFALSTAVQIEGILIQNWNQFQSRALDAAKYAIQAAIELYGLKVNEFNANIEAYKAQAQVYTARIQAELSKVELYRAQLEGQKLIGELNQQDIAIYSEQIKAVLALYELYKAKLDAVKTQLQGDQIKLQSFESEIKAFESLVRVKQMEYENFKILNDVQVSKAEIYKSRVTAYAAQTDAFAKVVEARKSIQDAEIEINKRIPLEVFKQQSEAIRTQIQAESERIKAISETNQVNASIFETETKAETARIQGETAAQEQEVKYLTAQSQARIESVKANISSLLAQTEMLIEAMKSAAQVASQLAAASLSVVNLSASISESESTSTSNSISSSQSTSRIISTSE